MGRRTLLVAALFLSALLYQCYAVCDYDYRTGNRQLEDATNAALFRLRASGFYDQLKARMFTAAELVANRDYPDPYCAVENGEETFPFPTNPAGTLRSILERGTWRMATTQDDDAPFYVYTTNPPTGIIPEADRALVELVGQHYGVNLSIEYVFLDTDGGSNPVFQKILTNGADSTDADFALGVTLTLPNGQTRLRRSVLGSSCSVYNTASFITVARSSNLINYDQLAALISQSSNYSIGSSGPGSVLTVEALFPNVTVIDYGADANTDYHQQLQDDLLSGAIIAAYNFAASDFDNLNALFDFPSIVTTPLGYYFRQDQYSPSYAPPTPSPSATPTPPNNGGSHSGTNINFYFSGMLNDAN